MIGGGTSYDEFVLPSMGDEVIGHVSALQYSAALDTPKNAAFVKKYRAKYGKVPSYYSETNYTTAQMIHEVIKKNNGKFPGAEEFIKQLAAIKVDTLRGPVSIDEMRNPVQNIYIKKVEKKKMFGYDKDELWNTVIKTYPNVSQFGTVQEGRVPEARRSTAATSALQVLQLARTREPGLRIGAPASFTRIAEDLSVSADTPTNGRTPVLELKGLSKSFGGLHAVRGVTLKIMPGDRKAIIGPNGAGKTTLFNLITGIFPATSGQVLLFGQDVTGWPSHRRTALGMARTFQITSLFPQADRARQRAAGDQGPAAVEIRDVALPVVLSRRLRQGASAAGAAPASWTARTPRFATFRTASSASSRSCSGSPAIRRSCCSTSRRPVCPRASRSR